MRKSFRLRLALHVTLLSAGVLVLFSSFLYSAMTRDRLEPVALTVLLVASISLIFAGAWWISARAVRPIEALSVTAAGVNARDLGERITLASADHEFEALIEVMNGMLERLERSFSQANRFAADAAHELNTPLAALQLQIGDALQSASDSDRPIFARLQTDVVHLKSIVQKLLLLAKADSGSLPLQVEPTDLSAITQDLVEDIQLLNPDLEIKSKIPDTCPIDADHILLTQALSNLVRNAVRYNLPRNGWIFLHIEREGD